MSALGMAMLTVAADVSNLAFRTNNRGQHGSNEAAPWSAYGRIPTVVRDVCFWHKADIA